MIEPCSVATVSAPFACCTFDAVDHLQVAGIGFEPRRQRRPLPKQAFMRYLDHVDACPAVRHQESGADETVDNGAQLLRNFVDPGHAPHRCASFRIYASKPWYKRSAQPHKLLFFGRWDCRRAAWFAERLDHRGFDRALHSAEPAVFVQSQAAIGAVVCIKALERKAEQRQGVGTLRIRDELFS